VGLQWACLLVLQVQPRPQNGQALPGSYEPKYPGLAGRDPSMESLAEDGAGGASSRPMAVLLSFSALHRRDLDVTCKERMLPRYACEMAYPGRLVLTVHAAKPVKHMRSSGGMQGAESCG
jgi:hypothetical protein